MSEFGNRIDLIFLKVFKAVWALEGVDLFRLNVERKLTKIGTKVGKNVEQFNLVGGWSLGNCIPFVTSKCELENSSLFVVESRKGLVPFRGQWTFVFAWMASGN